MNNSSTITAPPIYECAWNDDEESWTDASASVFTRQQSYVSAGASTVPYGRTASMMKIKTVLEEPAKRDKEEPMAAADDDDDDLDALMNESVDASTDVEAPPPVNVDKEKLTADDLTLVDTEDSSVVEVILAPEDDLKSLENPKKNQRRKFIIIGGVMVLLGLIAILVGVVVGSNKGNGDSVTGASVSANDGGGVQQQPTATGDSGSSTNTATTAETPATLQPVCIVDVVSTERSCYTIGEDILVSFSQCNPQINNWVGFYPSNTVELLNADELVWLWTCGTTGCNGEVFSNNLLFTTVLLPEGEWEAHLAKDDGEPYSSKARSAPFTVAAECPP
jgi:hypothetical protein